MYTPERILIIGYGRFGKLLYTILSEDFQVTIFDPKVRSQTTLATALDEAVQSADTIIYAIPIDQFEQTIKTHMAGVYSHLTDSKVIIDVCSVKEYPLRIMQEQIKPPHKFLVTHPMFGPTSYKENKGSHGLRFMLDQDNSDKQAFTAWYKYLSEKQFTIIQMSSEEHDRLAAASQGVAHFIGRGLERIEHTPTSIDTVNAGKLNEIQESVISDSYELFLNLQKYNRFASEARKKLLKALEDLDREIGD
jgi:prephenate dehydrogenase